MLYSDPKCFQARRNAAAIRSWVDCQIACAATGSHSVDNTVCELRVQLSPASLGLGRKLLPKLSNRVPDRVLHSRRRGAIKYFSPTRASRHITLTWRLGWTAQVCVCNVYSLEPPKRVYALVSWQLSRSFRGGSRVLVGAPAP